MSSEGLRALVVNTALVSAGLTVGGMGAWRGANGFLARQARIARTVIPKPTTRAHQGDGIYRPGAHAPEPWLPGDRADLHVMVFGDSLAAGFGADSPGDLPGVLIARGLAEESGLCVRLSTKAIVGATSLGLEGQVEAMQIVGGHPDVAVILVGGNDVTARHGISASAQRLGRAVEMLVASGAHVVVGTCPDLGIIKPVPQPLRAVLHTLSTRLAVAQASQVVRAGGRPVSLAETLAPEFHADPDRLFSPDRFHPNSAGYELAAGLLLPAVCEALGVWETTAPEAPAPEAQTSDAPTTDAQTTASDRSAETVTDQTGSDGQPAADSVVGRLTRRLTDFLRTHEGAPGRAGRRGWHDEAVDSADTGEAREAADTLRRHSRILTGTEQP